MVQSNQKLLLGFRLNLESTGVTAGTLDPIAAQKFATYFANHTTHDNDELVFIIPNPDGASRQPQRCRGFEGTYDKTHGDMSLEDLRRAQKKRTILIRAPYELDCLRDLDTGFATLEEGAGNLAAVIAPVGTSIILNSIHIIKQAGTGDGLATTFKMHQDDEHEPNNIITVLVRLSSYGSTYMHVAGAPNLFKYGSLMGSAGAFASGLHHQSVPAEAEQLKIAFFFQKVTNRRTKKRAFTAI